MCLFPSHNAPCKVLGAVDIVHQDFFELLAQNSLDDKWRRLGMRVSIKGGAAACCTLSFLFSCTRFLASAKMTRRSTEQWAIPALLAVLFFAAHLSHVDGATCSTEGSLVDCGKRLPLYRRGSERLQDTSELRRRSVKRNNTAATIPTFLRVLRGVSIRTATTSTARKRQNVRTAVDR